MTVTRRQAREWAIQMLTAADMKPGSTADEVALEFWEQMQTLEENEGGLDGGALPKEKIRLFAEDRVRGVLTNLEKIDVVLIPLLAESEWDLYRLGTVERAVLRMGLWELMFSDVPRQVVINEAVDLVNWFSSPRSRQLVNAVLDAYGKGC